MPRSGQFLFLFLAHTHTADTHEGYNVAASLASSPLANLAERPVDTARNQLIIGYGVSLADPEKEHAVAYVIYLFAFSSGISAAKILCYEDSRFLGFCYEDYSVQGPELWATPYNGSFSLRSI